MQFTPQQLAGAGRYGSKTRIGNWNEDVILDENRMKEYRLRKQQGTLSTFAQQQKFVICNQRVPHSYADDGVLRFGQYVMLKHAHIEGVLANDIWDEVIAGSGEYHVSVAEDHGPLARNVFRLVSATNQDDVGGVLTYGAPFRLMCNESLIVDGESKVLKPFLYLKSMIKSGRASSPLSVNQLVSLSSEANSNTLWIASRAESAGAEKFLAAGSPVRTDDAVSLIHKMTGQSLYASSKYSFSNDFGKEYEVCCLSIKHPGKRASLVGELIGTKTIDTLSKADLPENTWYFVLGSSPEAALDTRSLPSAATPELLLDLVRESIIKKRSSYGFRVIHCLLKGLDENGSNKLDREDVKWALKDFGVNLTDQQHDIILSKFDRGHNEMINLSEFLFALRGEVLNSRKKVINEVYEYLNGVNNGKLTLAHLEKLYDVSVDSRVQSGEINPEDALKEFISLWGTKKKESIIHKDEFMDYYTDVSAAIDSTAAFTSLMQQSFRLNH